MKKLIVVLCILLYQTVAQANMVDCGQTCYTETQYTTSYGYNEREIFHHDSWSEKVPMFSRFYKELNESKEVKHDCLDYKKWDEIADSTKNGGKTGYKLENNKLFTDAGKRYLRCNDPNNPANQKYLEWVTKDKEWVEKVYDPYEIKTPYDVTRCYPNGGNFYNPNGGYYGGGYGGYGGGGYNNYYTPIYIPIYPDVPDRPCCPIRPDHPDKPDHPVAPVPEPSPVLMVGIGMLFFSNLLRKRKK